MRVHEPRFARVERGKEVSDVENRKLALAGRDRVVQRPGEAESGQIEAASVQWNRFAREAGIAVAQVHDECRRKRMDIVDGPADGQVLFPKPGGLGVEIVLPPGIAAVSVPANEQAVAGRK